MMTRSEDTNRGEYISRINRVLDFIDGNLHRELTLRELAEIACFSPFHFHRIFRAFLDEPLARFILRIRLERAAGRLLREPHEPVTQIASNCGFATPSAFARAFKRHFGVSATEWREASEEGRSKQGQVLSKGGRAVRNHGKAAEVSPPYLDGVTSNLRWRIRMETRSSELKADVAVEELAEMNVAYVRHVGRFKGDSALFEGLFAKLCGWAGPRGLIRGGETRFLTLYHDDPEITAEERCRLSVCLTVPEGTEVQGEIGTMSVAGGKYARARFELDPSQYEDAWNAIYRGWLPGSGYQPDDRPCMEVFHGDPKEHPEGKHVVEICVPVKLL